MKELIIYSHLNPQSFSKAIVDQSIANAKAKGHEVQLIDLHADNFNPIFNMADIASVYEGAAPAEDIKRYQEQIRWADHITMVFPLWWGQMPAVLKGFIDRVFTNGFALSYGEEGPKGLLAGKTAQIIVNTGTPSEHYEASGMHEALKRVFVEGVMGFCGIESEITFFGNVNMGSQEDRQAYLASLK